ncbi:MAG TPA: glycosyltransferase [Candidatus Paceibacterota bacterium]
MEILYVSSVPSKDEFVRMKKELRKNVNVSTYGLQESGYKFHTLILEGLCANKETHIKSLVGRSINIKTYNGIYWKNRKEEISKNLYFEHLGVVNLPVLKQLFLGLLFFIKTISWLFTYRKEPEKFIIMDAAYITMIPFVLLASSIIKCKKLAIFCDIYEYMGDVKDARVKSKYLHIIVRYFVSLSYKMIDAFILLTEQMNDIVNRSNKPFIIMEGLVDIEMENIDNLIKNKHSKNVIIYAGALRMQYGLKNLIDGFMDYADDNAMLWIFGTGDYSQEIKLATKKDSRIVFYGLVDNSIVVKKEIEATLLVNPRPANQEFTKFSFPSKNMEYMVSGTPVLSTKMPGIPEEYFEHMYIINGDTARDITLSLIEVFQKSKEELNKKGVDAKFFVLEKKNNIAQAMRIVEFVRENLNQ